MSRLDSFIRRMTAQRSVLDAAMHIISGRAGFVLELGLGNGRTYDHLKQNLPDREIFVFERKVAAHPDSIPPASRLYETDMIEGLQQFHKENARSAILVHADTGTGDKSASEAFARDLLSPALMPVLLPGAVIVSDQKLDLDGAVALDLPEDVTPGKIHFYQMP